MFVMHFEDEKLYISAKYNYHHSTKQQKHLCGPQVILQVHPIYVPLLW